MALDVLLVGVGARGRTWLRVLHEVGVRVLACVDPSQEALEWLSVEHPTIPRFATLDQALDTARGRACAAVVVTPPIQRARIVLPLLAAGLDVISEKPLETDLAEAVRMVLAADAARRQLTVCLNFRFLPVTLALKAHLQGRWGPVTSGAFLYHINRDGRRPGLNRFPLIMDDPMLLEQSIHHLDLLRFAYGAEIQRVRAEIFNPKGSMYRGDATVAALCEMTRGIRATYIGSWVTGSNIRAFQWRTDCRHGVVVQRQLFEGLEAGPLDGPMQPVPVDTVEPFVTDTRLYARAALDALDGGTPAPCSGRDHLRSLAATLACRRSADTGEAVNPDDLLREAGLYE